MTSLTVERLEATFDRHTLAICRLERQKRFKLSRPRRCSAERVERAITKRIGSSFVERIPAVALPAYNSLPDCRKALTIFWLQSVLVRASDKERTISGHSLQQLFGADGGPAMDPDAFGACIAAAGLPFGFIGHFFARAFPRYAWLHPIRRNQANLAPTNSTGPLFTALTIRNACLEQHRMVQRGPAVDARSVASKVPRHLITSMPPEVLPTSGQVDRRRKEGRASLTLLARTLLGMHCP